MRQQSQIQRNLGCSEGIARVTALLGRERFSTRSDLGRRVHEGFDCWDRLPPAPVRLPERTARDRPALRLHRAAYRGQVLPVGRPAQPAGRGRAPGQDRARASQRTSADARPEHADCQPAPLWDDHVRGRKDALPGSTPSTAGWPQRASQPPVHLEKLVCLSRFLVGSGCANPCPDPPAASVPLAYGMHTCRGGTSRASQSSAQPADLPFTMSKDLREQIPC